MEKMKISDLPGPILKKDGKKYSPTIKTFEDGTVMCYYESTDGTSKYHSSLARQDAEDAIKDTYQRVMNNEYTTVYMIVQDDNKLNMKVRDYIYLSPHLKELFVYNKGTHGVMAKDSFFSSTIVEFEKVSIRDMIFNGMINEVTVMSLKDAENHKEMASQEKRYDGIQVEKSPKGAYRRHFPSIMVPESSNKDYEFPTRPDLKEVRY